MSRREHFFRSGGAAPWGEVISAPSLSLNYERSIIDTLSVQDGVFKDYIIHDFANGVVPSASWGNNFPAGTVYSNIDYYGDGPRDTDLSIAVGEGRNGSNCLRCTYYHEGPQLLDGLYFVNYKSSGVGGSGKVNCSGAGHYQVPWIDRDGDADGAGNAPTFYPNVLDMWIKFPPGFYESVAGSTPYSYPNHRLMQTGTYYADPALVGGGIHETNNLHLYQFWWPRMDLFNSGDWMLFRMTAKQNSQRSYPNMPYPLGLTRRYGLQYGNLALFTRFYWSPAGTDAPKLFDPEISAPFNIDIDSVVLRQIPDLNPIVGDVIGYDLGSAQPYSVGEHTIQVTLQNESSDIVACKIGSHGVYTLNPVTVELVGGGGPTILVGGAVDISFDPFETKTFNVTFNVAVNHETHQAVGVYCYPSIFYNKDATHGMRSISNEYIENRWYENTGNHDIFPAEAYVLVLPE